MSTTPTSTLEERVANSEHAALPDDGPRILYCTHCGKTFPNAERVSTVERHVTSGDCPEIEDDLELAFSKFRWGKQGAGGFSVRDLTNKELKELRIRGLKPSDLEDLDPEFRWQYRLSLDPSLAQPETRRYHPGPTDRMSAWGRENLPDWVWRLVDDDKERAAIGVSFVVALFVGPEVLFATSAEFWSFLVALGMMVLTAATSGSMPASFSGTVSGALKRSSDRSTVGLTNPNPHEFILQGGFGLALGYLVSLALVEAGINTTDLLLSLVILQIVSL